MVRDGVKPKTIYDTIISNTGCVYFSASQSNELRDSKQVYRQSQQLKAKKKFGNENYDELIAATELQREKKDFIRSVLCLRNSYYMFIADDVQLNDVAFFVSMKMVFCQLTQRSISALTGLQILVTKTLDYRHKTESIRSFWGQFSFILKKILSSLIGLQAKCTVSSQR